MVGHEGAAVSHQDAIGHAEAAQQGPKQNRPGSNGQAGSARGEEGTAAVMRLPPVHDPFAGAEQPVERAIDHGAGGHGGGQ